MKTIGGIIKYVYGFDGAKKKFVVREVEEQGNLKRVLEYQIERAKAKGGDWKKNLHPTELKLVEKYGLDK